MICFPNAKINIGLYVTGRRHDGMHNIETCFLPIPFYDILEIRKSKKFSIKCFGEEIPENENIILKAWDLINTIKKNIQPVEVILYKNIPVGAGLGGGSSDVAFFLKALNTYYSLKISFVKLERIASQLGADSSFFIKNIPVIASGIGNVFTPINNPVANKQITLVVPKFRMSTKEAYSIIKPTNRSNIISIIESSINDWNKTLINDFEEIVFEKFPQLNSIKSVLYEAGAFYASLTGSGSGIYALSEKQLNINHLKKDYAVWSFAM